MYDFEARKIRGAQAILSFIYHIICHTTQVTRQFFQDKPVGRIQAEANSPMAIDGWYISELVWNKNE